MKIVISSGHGKYVAGAVGPAPWGLNEVQSARAVVRRVTELLQASGVTAIPFNDDVSRTQSENLKRIVDFHNAQGPHDLDVSVHFNAYQTSSKPMGTEVLFVSQNELAGKVSGALATALELPNRGAKKRTDLYFLNNTKEPAILIEVCFVDSSVDANHYHKFFEVACEAIAKTIGGTEQPSVDIPSAPSVLAHFKGKVSWFGGPEDLQGVTPSEGLAFIYKYEEAPYLFLDQQPPGTTGLARRLNPEVFYVACRWSYSVTPKKMLASPQQALVKANGREFLAYPADWGPNEKTGRSADISPGLMKALGIKTDDQVEVLYPAPTSPLTA
jgi:N-acetylmuramoyl-L-alanine amidase